MSDEGKAQALTININVSLSQSQSQCAHRSARSGCGGLVGATAICFGVILLFGMLTGAFGTGPAIITWALLIGLGALSAWHLSDSHGWLRRDNDESEDDPVDEEVDDSANYGMPTVEVKPHAEHEQRGRWV